MKTEPDTYTLTAHWWDEDDTSHPMWLQQALDDGRVFERDGFEMVETPEGPRALSMGDSIRRDADGNLWPVYAGQTAGV